jgi:hypothetical protein
MRFIITQPNQDGSYDEVGMRNRYLTSSYSTVKGLLRYGIAKHFTGQIRIEVYGENVFCDPFKTFYVKRGEKKL